jgi:hypothetical protein
MRFEKVALMFLFVVASTVASGCTSDHVSVVQPSRSVPTPEETAEYEREKLEMISVRD